MSRRLNPPSPPSRARARSTWRTFVTDRPRSGYQDGELAAEGIEQEAEVEAIALRFVILDKAACACQVEEAIVAVHGVAALADL